MTSLAGGEWASGSGHDLQGTDDAAHVGRIDSGGGYGIDGGEAGEDGGDAFALRQGFQLGAQLQVRSNARRLPTFEQGPDVLPATTGEDGQLDAGPDVIEGSLRRVEVAGQRPGV